MNSNCSSSYYTISLQTNKICNARKNKQTKTKQNKNKLEALRECRPPWPRQIITPILPTVKMLSLGGERLHPPPPPKKKVLDHYLHHDRGMPPILWCFFAHLFILEYPDHHQNLISSSLYYPGPLHKISAQSVHNFVSNVVHRQTNKQTNQRYQKHNLLCQGGNKQSGIAIKRPAPVAFIPLDWGLCFWIW